MSNYKGFGAPRRIQVVEIKDCSTAELDRCMAAYQRQGLSKEKAMEMVGISGIYLEAVDQGLTPGVDVLWEPDANDGEGGLRLSKDMAAYMKSKVPEQAWNYWKAEELITDATDRDEVREIDGEPYVNTSGFAKLLLHTVRDPSDTDDGGKKAFDICRGILHDSPLGADVADQKLRQWITNGDEELFQELVMVMARVVTAAARINQEDQR